MTSPTARALTPDDLAVFAAIREPLSVWLRDTHGRGDWRAGLLGLAGVAIALLGMHAFGVSPLLTVTHALIGLVADGLVPRLVAARRATSRSKPGWLFRSPGHALAFAQAVAASISGQGRLGNANMIPIAQLPGLRLDQPPSEPPIAEPMAPWARLIAPLVWSIVGLAWLGIAALVVLIVYPVLAAGAVIFDAYDWLGFSLLLAINVGQLASTSRELPAMSSSAPWQVAWLDAPPKLADLALWRQHRATLLYIAMLIGALVMLTPRPPIEGMHSDLVAFALALDAQVLDVATLLFLVLALLHAVLLTAPWHARRLIAALNSVAIPQR